jgi:threonylcarbamoyladenosine tRNA methylthiotransferase MtaB
MGRNYTRAGYMDLVAALRRSHPHFGISTDVIVGFPGETDEDFADTLNLVKSTAFLHVHVFPFSEREGTRAAGMSGQISPPIKSRRRDALISAGESASLDFINRNNGRECVVLPETFDENTGFLEGLTDNNLRARFLGNRELVGLFARIRLITWKNGKLFGELA